jgi:hypothetical protein
VPIDAQLKSRDAIDAETFALNEIIARIHSYNRQTIIFLDACRNSPLPAGEDDDPTPEGLAQLQTGDGTFIAFATQPGNVSVDGSGENSPFAQALLAHIHTPMITISDLMIRVRNDVKDATFGKQLPWDQSSLSQQFSFRPEIEVAAAGPAVRVMGVENPSDMGGREINVTGSVGAANANATPFKPGITISPVIEEDKLTVAARVPDQEQNLAKPGLLKPSVPEGRELRLQIQKQLSRLNCLSGETEGDWGRKTVTAIESVNRRTGLALSSLDANPDTLLELKSLSGPLCIIRCGKGQTLKGGLCIARKPPSKPIDKEKQVKPPGKSKAVAKAGNRKRPPKEKAVAKKRTDGSSGVTVGSGVGVGSFF